MAKRAKRAAARKQFADRRGSGALFRTLAARHRRPHRIHRRRDHVSDDGLHHIRQPDHSRQNRNGSGCGVRRHLCRRRGEHLGDGVLRQLPDRARARHGHQRVLRLHRRVDLQIYLATGARRGVLLGRAVLSDFGIPNTAIRHRCNSAKSEARRVGGRRLVPGDHRARRSQGGGRPSGDTGHPRRSHQSASGPDAARLRVDRRP